jgi:hemolysin activation/secretion protein
MFSAHTGTNVGVEEIVRAACDLQAEYAKLGHASVSVAVGDQEISNGIVTLNVFQSAVPQIRVSGKRYVCSSNEVTLASNLLGEEAPAVVVAPPVTNAGPVTLETWAMRPVLPPTPEEKALRKKLSELDLQERIARIPPQPAPTSQLITAPARFTETNDIQAALAYKMSELDRQARRAEMLPQGPTNFVAPTNELAFEVKGYELIGNTVLSSNITEIVLQPYIGTNITFEKVHAALMDLQTVYREHGFATVSVTLPQQTLTDKIVKIRVFEGRLVEISVVNNHYFSSNNVIRALPSLHPNMILTEPVFQAELDRANANQDRQIYPRIDPGPIEGTSALELRVQDRLPLHAKTDFNNENSPNTPELRVNSSAAYGNFFQLGQSLGLQYSFSPEVYKQGNEWWFYDRPLVANYSGFYRIPLGNPSSIEDTITTSTSFGYDEATRRFNLPPPTGQPELNIYASHSTIDTGTERSPVTTIFNIPGVRTITMQSVQDSLTVNSAEGLQFTAPLPEKEGLRSAWSAAVNYKSYRETTSKTNNFTISEFTVNASGEPNPPTISTVSSPVPLTDLKIDYLPITLRYDGSVASASGLTAFGMGVTANPWFSGTRSNMLKIDASTTATGYWVKINPSLTREFNLPRSWTFSAHAEGQWASEALIANEEYGEGGVNSVRGYHEGEVFGDTGWRVDFEMKSPPHVVGLAYGKQPLTIRGSAFTDYAQSFYLNHPGPGNRFNLWGAGIGTVVTIGPHWETRMWFAVPFDTTPDTTALHPRFNFSLVGQF